MIDHYQAPETLALLDKIGWPEWVTDDGDTVACRGYECQGRFWFTGAGGEETPRSLALCLLRSHLREYAEKAGMWIDARINQSSQVEYFVYDTRTEDDQFVDSFLDLDLALLAACKQALAN